MKLLENKIRKNRFDYNLVKRTTSSAIYSQHHEGDIISYEVFKVKKVKSVEMFGNLVEAHEKFPSDNDFGITAWSCRTLEKANERFVTLEEEAITKNQKKDGYKNEEV